MPRYAQALADARNSGRYPLAVNLCFGAKVRGVPEPRIQIEPVKYKPGKFNFYMLRGLRVTIWDIDGYADDVTSVEGRPVMFGKFYDLLRELAAQDAYVLVKFSDGLVLRVLDIANSSRWRNPVARRMEWPSWWSDALNEQQFARAKRWMMEVNEEIERERAAA